MMMTKNNIETVREVILKPMLALYRQPYGTQNLEQAMAQYIQDLAEFDAKTLQAAWASVRRAMPGRRYWPDPAEIRQACLERQQISYDTDRLSLTQKRFRVKEARQRLADQFLTNMIGQKALQEGWGLMLWEHISASGETDLSADILQNLKTKSQKLREKINQLSADPAEANNSISSACLGLWHAMQQRQEKLKQRFLTESGQNQDQQG